MIFFRTRKFVFLAKTSGGGARDSFPPSYLCYPPYEFLLDKEQKGVRSGRNLSGGGSMQIRIKIYFPPPLDYPPARHIHGTYTRW